MSEKELTDKIAELEKQIKEKDEAIQYLENLSEMRNNVITLANQERLESEKIIEAHERSHGIGHLLKSTIEDGKVIEGRDRDDITIVLPVKTILEDGIQLYDLLNDIGRELVAKRLILFMKEYNRFITRILLSIDIAEIQKPYFEFALSMVKETIKTKKGVAVKDKKLATDKGDIVISMTTIPLFYDKELLGVLYFDNKSTI